MVPSEVKKYRIGTSGYQFPDWFGTVYPPNLRQRNVLEYYANSLGLDTVEVNYTYYRLPSPRTSEAMARKVPEDFEFVVRSFSGMTHDIWEGTDRKTFKDATEVFDQFVQGILPFKEAGKLGPVLLQFPYSFWPNRVTYDYLKWCREKLHNFNVVVEFRNRAWNRPSAFRLLRELGMGYCIVDEPRLNGLHPFVPVATSKTGYVRFHGRNPKWFDSSKDDRYDYLYSEEELDEIIDAVKDVVRETNRTYFFFNNCPRGQALINALVFKRLVGLLEELNAAQEFALSNPGIPLND